MPLPPLQDPTGVSHTLRTVTVAAPMAGWLLSSVLVANAVQMTSLVTLPVSQRLFRRINREVVDSWWSMTVSLAERWNGVKPVLTGDEVPPLENALVVSNHQQMPDITFLMFLARAKGRLGDMKWFVKDTFKYVPGAGWGMLFIDCLFVKRDWAEDEASIGRTFGRIVKHRVPLWLMLFPEGTRLTAEKLEASREYARRRGLPPTEHVLLPRTHGFVASAQGLRGHLDAVYDVTIGYERGVPTLWQYVKGLAPRAHLHVRRFAMDELPRDDEGLSRWILDRFHRKDELLSAFYRDGAFPDRA